MIVPYELPFKDKTIPKTEKNTLRWDDILLELYPDLKLAPLNPEFVNSNQLEEVIREKMKAHNKWNEEKASEIEEKIKNTTKYLKTYPPYCC